MQIKFLASILEISPARWDSICPTDHPFIRHGFLAALETSNSVNLARGWQPQHLIVEEHGELIAAIPLYLKSHSYGEYVFDWSWADAYKRHNLDYYPKLITAIPFTPCTGTRFIFADFQRTNELLPLLISAIKNHARALQASSWHCLFPTQAISNQLLQSDSVQRIGCQFHWINHGYQCWDDFIATMNSRKRKNINKERRNVFEQGISFTIQEGAEITTDQWTLFYQLYCNTYLKRSGHTGYLTAEFFTLLSKHCCGNLVMITAQHNNSNIAASLYFKDSTTLYGRYWGCLEEYDFLHFETCYYQGIEYAIQHNLQRFDGGAQGEHKIQRGFEPIITYSNHWLAQPDFYKAIGDFVREEAPHIHAYQEDAKQLLPFKETHGAK